MGCPTTPLSCLDPVNIFAGVYNTNCGGFADPSKFQAERAVFNSGFSELINNFGVELDYYVNTYNLSSANNFYGEDAIAPFYGPFKIKAYVTYEHNAVPLVIAGWEPDDTVTMYVHIKGFETIVSPSNIHAMNGQRPEPKADDGFILTPFGCDRPGGRVAKRFVITEVIDEDSNTINPLGGHYVWKIHAKRFDFSYEAGFSEESNNNQVYDNRFMGISESNIQYIYPDISTDGTVLSSTLVTQLTSGPKLYNSDVDSYVIEKIFDNRVNNTSIYGEYF